jgi:hypothetical protein
MTNEQGTAQGTGESRADRCVCHEFMDQMTKYFEVSPAVKQHLMNSRVEFLKAIRAVIDQRIERLSGAAQRGSHITVE